MHMKRLSILVAVLILTACTVVEAPTLTASPSPTSTASVTPTATATATASVTPSPTVTPTATDILETPDFFASTIADNILFAPSTDPDCQLPCWQGLRVGESDQDDALQMFDEVFGLKVSDNFFHESPTESLLHNYEIPLTKNARYGWEFPSGTFNISVVIDDESLVLKGIHLTHSSRPRKLDLHTPQEIMQHAGSPSEIYMEPEFTSGGNNIYLKRLMLVYDEGMAFWFSQEVSAIQQGDTKYVNLCFNSTVILGTYTFVEPFDSLEGNLDLVQAEWIQRFALRTVLEPSEAVVGMTAEEIAAVAVQEENPCILEESVYLND